MDYGKGVGMSAKHTPGPWKWESGYHETPGNYSELLDRYGERVVGSCDGCAIIFSEADARLIAAAPEMLKELKHLRSLVGSAIYNGISIPGLATMNGADAIIAKAEGRS